jgi:hypothetical protein
MAPIPETPVTLACAVYPVFVAIFVQSFALSGPFEPVRDVAGACFVLFPTRRRLEMRSRIDTLRGIGLLNPHGR